MSSCPRLPRCVLALHVPQDARELSALGVLMIVALSLLVMVAQRLGGRLGVRIA